MPTRPRPPRPPHADVSCATCGWRSQSVFACLPKAALAALDAKPKLNRFARGQVLYSEANTPLAAYCVESGVVKRYRYTEDGRQHILGLAGPGALLGAAHLLAGVPFAETAEAVEPVRACVIDAATLRETLQLEPALWEEIVRDACRAAVKVQEILLSRSNRPAVSKLAEVVLKLTRQGPDSTMLFTRQDLADMIGVSQETAIRALSQLRRRGLVSVEGRKLTVLRPEKLAALAANGGQGSA